MADASVFRFFTAKGVGEAGQEASLAALKVRLGEPGAKVMVHVHGGLVDRAAGTASADRLSGTGSDSFGLTPDWTQVYIIWQTGALEEIRRRWTELAKDDRLYQALVRKLIMFLAQRLSLPLMDGRSAADTAPLGEDEILRRIRGEGDKRDPFGVLEQHLRSADPTSRAVMAPRRTTGALMVEFSKFLAADPLFRLAVADMDAAANTDTASRAAAPAGSVERGEAILARLDGSLKGEIDLLASSPDDTVPRTGGRGFVSVGAFVAGRALKAAMGCIERFRGWRDHGLHATIVEEVCREFYGDWIGSTIWGWMVDDAGLHFGQGGFGATLLAMLAADPPERMVVTAHSAGSIWASRMLLAMAGADAKTPIDLCLLAPAVRANLFVEAVTRAAPLVRRCHMFTMDDALESRDAVLGHDQGYIYPRSLLYLVSGLFETKDGEAYPDAPILGMQRFVGVDWLDGAEAADAAAVSAFFAQPDKAIHYSPGSGMTDADSHGGFDDNVLTLKSVNEQVFAQ